MSVPLRDRQASFFDVSFLTQNLFDGQDSYSLFRQKVLPALEAQREKLGAMYCATNGRPALDPVLVAGVTLLQFMEKAPDRQAIERLRMHLGWKLALGLAVDDAGFHPTTLVYFRQRLLEHQQGRVAFDALLQGLEQQQEAHGLGRADTKYVDSAYVTDDTLAQAAAEGRELIGPAHPAINSRGKGFTTEPFDISMAQRRAVCPAGRTSTRCSRLENQQTGQIDYRFEWGSQCDDCPLRAQCTKARNGRRAVTVSQHHDLLQARRREMQTPAFQEQMHQRNAIEGTISEFARNGGRRTRYRGLAKTTLANYFHGAALNAKRWIRLLQYRMGPNAAATL